jgi:hypothetical protein
MYFFVHVVCWKILSSILLYIYRRLSLLMLRTWCVYILRDYYMTFSISALVLAQDSHIKPDSEAGRLILVEGWYQGPYGKFHVIIFLSHILHWPFPSIDFYIAKKIYEQTNCENKSLRVAFVQLANIFVSNLV